MARSRELPRPTEAELSILEVLWEIGPGTVRQVHDALHTRGGRTGYTTVLKLMQIMTQKGLVERDESRRSHVYRPASTQDSTRRGLVGALIEGAFAGSTSQLVLSALSAKRTSRKELDEIRRFLERESGAKRNRKG